MNILVIEDDPDTQANLTDLLEMDGHEVHSARSIADALAWTRWDAIGAILLDRRLSDGTTDELLPRLSELAPLAGIIVMTGYVDLDNTIHALRHGAADYILKPINPDALRLSINRLQQMQEAKRQIVQNERLAAIGQVAAGIAHESRNALQRIQAAVELLQMELKNRPELLIGVERIERAADDIGALLEEVRNYAGPICLQREICDLPSIWRQAWEQVIAKNEVDVELTESVMLSPARASIDAFRLRQVFHNLFENSLSACSQRQPRIDIECKETDALGDRAIQISLRDNGVGFSAEQRAKAFEPFYTTKTKGTGLGMPICRRIIEAHGGSLNIGARNGPGAEIIIRLPGCSKPVSNRASNYQSAAAAAE